jgi:hypothetical protein
MPQVESCRLITGRRVPANPLEVRTSPIVIDSSQSRLCATDYLRKLFMHPTLEGAGPSGDLMAFPQFSRMIRKLFTLVW